MFTYLVTPTMPASSRSLTDRAVPTSRVDTNADSPNQDVVHVVERGERFVHPAPCVLGHVGDDRRLEEVAIPWRAGATDPRLGAQSCRGQHRLDALPGSPRVGTAPLAGAALDGRQRVIDVTGRCLRDRADDRRGRGIDAEGEPSFSAAVFNTCLDRFGTT
jgi:hypothetical protein